jgi:formate hydrogenlyase subunit 6/NADH:ubiquinone oxidoreductase subunit I
MALDEARIVPGAGDDNPPPPVDPRAMQIDANKLARQRKRTFGIGLLKGLGVTLKHLFKHNTVIEYPDERQDLAPRTRGVIALKEENCTVCMLCGRECPDWCIYIDSHKETLPPKRAGGRPRKRNVLDRFAIDYALCMYCGICVEVCPYDALFWSREFEYAEFDIRELTHEKERLSDWMATVLPPPELEVGAELPGQADGAAPPATTAAPAPAPAAAPAPTVPAAPAPTPRPAEVPSASAASESATDSPEASQPPEASSTSAPAPAREAAASVAAEPGPNVEIPHEAPRPVALDPTEDPETVYQQVLKEQLEKGSSPQVAEARAKVARVKAERGIKRGPTPVATEKLVPSAPTKGSVAPPAGPPSADASGSDTKTVSDSSANRPQETPSAGSTVAGTSPEAVYERVLAEERAKGSSDAVAMGRAKAARVKAERAAKGGG